MTETLFHTDSYLRDFEAAVQEVDTEAQSVTLDRTAFYPGGGGQPCDQGTIRCSGGSSEVEGITLRVGEVGKKGASIVHKLERVGASAGDLLELPSPGTTIRGSIDWNRRYRLMRTHTAMHILCGVVWRDYGAQVTGGNMEPLAGRMDFEFENLRRELVAEIEAKINAEVDAAREVRVAIQPRAQAEAIPDLIRTKINLVPRSITEIRTVEIVGLDLQADGGTHVGNTREVGRLRIVDYKSKGRINKRLHVAVGDS